MTTRQGHGPSPGPRSMPHAVPCGTGPVPIAVVTVASKCVATTFSGPPPEQWTTSHVPAPVSTVAERIRHGPPRISATTSTEPLPAEPETGKVQLALPNEPSVSALPHDQPRNEREIGAPSAAA